MPLFEDDTYECSALLQPCISGRPPFGELPPIQRAPPAAFPRPRSDNERHNMNILTSEGHFRYYMHYRIAAEKYFPPTIRKCKEDCALLFHCQCRNNKSSILPYLKCAQCTIMHLQSKPRHQCITQVAEYLLLLHCASSA